MLLFGHRFIPSEHLYHILDIDTIPKTPNSSILYIDFDENNLDVIEHMQINSISFALSVQDITQLIYASALRAKYIIVPQTLAKSAQSIAEMYLFDAKILVSISSEESIEEMALLGIDGVIFPDAIVKISS